MSNGGRSRVPYRAALGGVVFVLLTCCPVAVAAEGTVLRGSGGWSSGPAPG